MSEADYLVGVEEYELAFVEDVLDDSPVDAQTVYKETIDMSERAIAAEAAFRAASGGAGGPPSGAAGGVLGGSYPNPSFAADMATQAELDALSAVYQPLDSDLTAVAALTTTAFGRGLLELANGAALLSAAGAQASDADLTSIAALTTTAFGRSLLESANAAALRVLADSPSNAEAVLDSLFDANTVLAADSDNTPAALTMGASTILARLAAGNIKAATVAEIATLIGPGLPGAPIAYVERTSALTVTATTEGAAQEVVSSGVVAYDGTAVWVEFFAPKVQTGADGRVLLTLFDDTTPIGIIADVVGSSTGGIVGAPVNVRRRLTPTAANHTYRVLAHRVTADGTVTGGNSGTGAFLPAFIRVTKA